MTSYIIKRIFFAAVTLLVILFVSYLLLRLAPGDPTKSNILGSDIGATQLSADNSGFGMNQAMREKLYLDKPVYYGFAMWLTNAIRGDFGTSAAVEPGRPVTDIILERLPVTLKLNFFAIIVTYILAVPLGVFSAVKPNSVFDKTAATVTFILYSMPVIWVGLLLQSLLCRGGVWPLFPVKGLTPPTSYGTGWGQMFFTTAQYYFLPVLCLSYAGFAGISRYTRASMIEVMQQDYITTAKAKGAAATSIIWHHAFRNGLITLITLFSGLLPGLVAGSIIVEQIFAIPGMGSLSIISLSSRDYPLQMALFAFTGVLTLAGIFLADILYTAADPRISFDRRK